MAVIISATTARVRITYTVLQHLLAYWANSIYREDIRLIGDDFPFSPADPSGTDVTLAWSDGMRCSV